VTVEVRIAQAMALGIGAHGLQIGGLVHGREANPKAKAVRHADLFLGVLGRGDQAAILLMAAGHQVPTVRGGHKEHIGRRTGHPALQRGLQRLGGCGAVLERQVIAEHDEALGLDHEDLTLTRVDETFKGDHRRGLDALLKSAPVGFASWCEIGWVAHTAPVKRLRLYRLAQDGDDDLFAIAPNIDIAASVFTSALQIPIGETRMLHIGDGMKELPDDKLRNLPQLLEFGPIGLVEFDPAAGWSQT